MFVHTGAACYIFRVSCPPRYPPITFYCSGKHLQAGLHDFISVAALRGVRRVVAVRLGRTALSILRILRNKDVTCHKWIRCVLWPDHMICFWRQFN